MKNVSEVLLEAALLGTDVQTRIVCPFCQGGSTGERCMSIVRTAAGDVKYICHRSNCGIVGRSNTPNSVVAESAQPPRPIRPVRLGAIPEKLYDNIWYKWSIPRSLVKALGWKWDDTSNRLAMTVYGPTGSLRGLVLRTLEPDVTPKVLNVQWEQDSTFLAWHKADDVWGPHRGVVLVEDIPSAVRVAELGIYTHAVSLNGTHISDSIVEELRSNCASGEIILALDEDASEKALEYARKLNLVLGRIRVILLMRDFKDMSDKEAKACLRNVL